MCTELTKGLLWRLCSVLYFLWLYLRHIHLKFTYASTIYIYIFLEMRGGGGVQRSKELFRKFICFGRVRLPWQWTHFAFIESRIQTARLDTFAAESLKWPAQVHWYLVKISTLTFSNLLHFTLLFSEDKNIYLFKFAFSPFLQLLIPFYPPFADLLVTSWEKWKDPILAAVSHFWGNYHLPVGDPFLIVVLGQEKQIPFWQRVSHFWRNYDLPFLIVVLGEEVKIVFWHGSSPLPQPAQGSDGVSPPLVRFPASLAFGSGKWVGEPY